MENLIRRRILAVSGLVLHCLPLSCKKDARLKWFNGFIRLVRYNKLGMVYCIIEGSQVIVLKKMCFFLQ